MSTSLQIRDKERGLGVLLAARVILRGRDMSSIKVQYGGTCRGLYAREPQIDSNPFQEKCGGLVWLLAQSQFPATTGGRQMRLIPKRCRGMKAGTRAWSGSDAAVYRVWERRV